MLTRRYDLDWLRFIAFSLLIFYHIGMFYVTWDWHVKSIYASSGPEPLMRLVNPWRLALLFFISGVAVRFASDKLPRRQFLRSRLRRLGLPILLGVFVVVPPQTFFEVIQDVSFSGSFLRFYPVYLDLRQSLPVITPTWNHLWYVAYLLTYIVVLLLTLQFLSRAAGGPVGVFVSERVGNPVFLMLSLTTPFFIYSLVFGDRFPATHDLVNDWHNHANRFTTFLIGYFAAKNVDFWRGVDRMFRAGLAIAAAVAGLILLDTVFPDVRGRHPLPHWLAPLLMTLYTWAVIAVLLSLSARYLNRPSRALSYLTEAIFPYYILHQTFIVVAGFYLTQHALGAWTEFVLVTLATVIGCALLHEYVIRRVRWLRPWFGLQ